MKHHLLSKGTGSPFFVILAMAICLTLTSCNKNPDQAEIPEQSSDPAQANLAQADQQAPAQAFQQPTAPAYRAPARSPQGARPTEPYTPTAQTAQPYPPQVSETQSAPQSQQYDPAYSQNPNQSYEQTAPNYPEESASNQQPIEAEQPPPPLPAYTQPQCPGDNYLWTPGYWAYAPAGYFWVPGAWVVAPYVGALWTPPYWAYAGSRYRWHGGYWGPHIGFYGGINYGFGYFGRGYEGGYWDRNRRVFNYNRSVNNVNTTVIHNVYNYRIVNNTTTINNTRISYNGGRGGVEYRPSPQEIAVLHEQRIAPVAAQMQHKQQAEMNRAQFATADHGRPEMLVTAHPLATGYRQPAAHALAVPEARPLPQSNGGQQPAPPQNASNPAAGRSGFQPSGPAIGQQDQQHAGQPVRENESHPGQGYGNQPRPIQTNAGHVTGGQANANQAYQGREHPERQENFPARPAGSGVSSQPAPLRPASHTPPPAPAPRAAPQRFEDRSGPRPQNEQRTIPEPRVEQRPASQAASLPQPRVEPEAPARPLPQPRMEQRPAPPQPRVEPTPQPHVAPQSEQRQQQAHPEPAPAAKPPTHTPPPHPEEHGHHG